MMVIMLIKNLAQIAYYKIDHWNSYCMVVVASSVYDVVVAVVVVTVVELAHVVVVIVEASSVHVVVVVVTSSVYVIVVVVMCTGTYRLSVNSSGNGDGASKFVNTDRTTCDVLCLSHRVSSNDIAHIPPRD